MNNHFEFVENAIERARRTLAERKIYARITIELDPKDWDDFRATMPTMRPYGNLGDSCILNGHVVRLKREP